MVVLISMIIRKMSCMCHQTDYYLDIYIKKQFVNRANVQRTFWALIEGGGGRKVQCKSCQYTLCIYFIVLRRPGFHFAFNTNTFELKISKTVLSSKFQIFENASFNYIL